MTKMRFAVLTLAMAVTSATAAPLLLDREPEPGEVSYRPEDSSKCRVNPPSFVWLPVEGAKGYVLQISRSPEFPKDSTLQQNCAITLECLHQPLDAGTWYWRYGVRTLEDDPPQFSKARSFEIAPDAQRLPLPEVSEVVKRLSALRPRIALRPGDLEKYRAQARGEMAWAVTPLLASARREIGKELMPEPPFTPKGEKREPTYSQIFVSLRPFYDGMVNCAEAYLLTADESCGQEARRRLMHFMSWDPHGSTSLEVHDEQCTEFVRKCSRVYDSVYPLLPEAERARCHEVFAARLPQIYKALREMPFEARPFRSHAMGYYVPDLTEACIALAGELPVEEMLDYCLHLFWSPYYPPFGGDDGGWSDGPMYWAWYWHEYARICAVVERATGAAVGNRPLTHNAPLYKIYCNPPWSKMSPFGDGQALPADRPDTMYLLGAWLRDPHALWYAQQFNYKASGLSAFLFAQGDVAPKAPDDLPLARAFKDAGLVAMRSSLSDKSHDVELLMRSSPMGSMSHGYADQNAFALFAYGEPLAIESGYYDVSNGPHQRQWARTTKAANSITVDGEGQTVYRAAARGHITDFVSNDYAHYALGDAREAYMGRLEKFDRHLIYLRPRDGDEPMIVIYDDLRSAKPVTYQWWLHALESMKVDEAHAQVTLHRGEARLRVQFLSPGKLHFAQTDQFTMPPTNDIHRNVAYENQWHLTAHADAPSKQQQFISVLLPYRAGNEASLPTVRLIEGTGCRVVELQTPHARHVVLLRNPGETAPISANGSQSKGKIFAAGFSAAGKATGTLEIQ